MPNYIFIITEDMTGRFLAAYTQWSDVLKYFEKNCDDSNPPYHYCVSEYNADAGVAIHDYKYERKEGDWSEGDWREGKWNEYAAEW